MLPMCIYLVIMFFNKSEVTIHHSPSKIYLYYIIRTLCISKVVVFNEENNSYALCIEYN